MDAHAHGQAQRPVHEVSHGPAEPHAPQVDDHSHSHDRENESVFGEGLALVIAQERKTAVQVNVQAQRQHHQLSTSRIH